ncbi:hypothetical protein [Streptomyces sp. NPDC087212]|uniref:hypothetical protein n=1 Tax=Streptomyces sp. NPDC087212 TaxID=3365766 RepID=UPI00381D2EDD
MTHPREDREEPEGEEALRVMLARITPSGTHPGRIREIRHRVRARRRRRIALTSAAALTVLGAVTAHTLLSPRAGNSTTATPTASWAPPGFTDLPLSDAPAPRPAGWHTEPLPNAEPGTAVVATYRPKATTSPLSQIPRGGALVLYTQAEPGSPRVAVRRLDHLETWCHRAGGTQELIRVPRTTDAPQTPRTGYACLNTPSPTLIEEATEILATRNVSG